jgi:hypothetical protein
MVDSALKNITKLAVMPDLPKTRALMQPKPTPEGMIGAAELGPALSEISEAERQASMRVGEADIAIEEAKRQEKGKEAELREELVGRMATEARNLPERQALTAARTEFGNMAFVPTKETTQDLAGIFSLMSIVGMVVGKGNAQLAMSSMNGMLEGYQKGRADLYKKELTQFDKNFKAMQSKVLTLEKELSEAMELKKLDREKGDLAITMALAKAESPLLNAMRNRLGDVAVSNGVQDTKKTLITLATMVNDVQGKANAREDASAARAQQERLAAERERRADERARLARLDKGGKLSPKERGEVRGINNLTEEIQRLKETFKPEFANFKADVIGDAAAKFQARVASNPDMANWWRRYENVALPERHSMFGATLTGKESEAWRKANIGAGSSTAEILSWIGDKERVLTNKLADYEMTAASRPSRATGDIEQDAIRFTKSYEPDIYEYGYENGKFFRDLKEKK